MRRVKGIFMKILVIGGSGFISGVLVRRLWADGHQVEVVCRRERTGALPPGVLCHTADRAQPGALELAIGAQTYDVVVDCVAYQRSHVEQLFAELGERFGAYLLLSSAVVYVSGQSRPVREDHATQGFGEYGTGKLEVEQAALTLGEQFERPVTVVRPGEVVGPRDLLQGRMVRLLQRLQQGLPVVVPGSVETRLGYLDVEDLARLLTLAVLELGELVEAGAVSAQLYNAAGAPHTFGAWVAALAQALGVEPTVLELGWSWHEWQACELRPKLEWVLHVWGDLVMDTSAARERLGWQPRYSLGQSAQRFVDWALNFLGVLLEAPVPDAVSGEALYGYTHPVQLELAPVPAPMPVADLYWGDVLESSDDVPVTLPPPLPEGATTAADSFEVEDPSHERAHAQVHEHAHTHAHEQAHEHEDTQSQAHAHEHSHEAAESTPLGQAHSNKPGNLESPRLDAALLASVMPFLFNLRPLPLRVWTLEAEQLESALTGEVSGSASLRLEVALALGLLERLPEERLALTAEGWLRLLASLGEVPRPFHVGVLPELQVRFQALLRGTFIRHQFLTRPESECLDQLQLPSTLEGQAEEELEARGLPAGVLERFPSWSDYARFHQRALTAEAALRRWRGALRLARLKLETRRGQLLEAAGSFHAAELVELLSMGQPIDSVLAPVERLNSSGRPAELLWVKRATLERWTQLEPLRLGLDALEAFLTGAERQVRQVLELEPSDPPTPIMPEELELPEVLRLPSMTEVLEAAEAPQSPLQPGQRVPSFEAESTHGSLSAEGMRGRWWVLYFYPQDHTAGCTVQSCRFRDDHPRYEALRAQVVGVSVDELQSHVGFRERYGLPFPLVADPERTLARRFGVLDPQWGWARRFTFIINPEGELVASIDVVDIDAHSAQVLELLEKAQGGGAS